MKLFEKVLRNHMEEGKLGIRASFKSLECIGTEGGPCFRAHLDPGARLVVEGRLDPSEIPSFVKWLAGVYLEDDDWPREAQDA